MLRAFILTFGVLALLLGSAQAADSKVIEEIVAKVNGDIITLSDLERELKSIREQLASQYGDPAVVDREFEKVSKRALRNLIENKLMLQRAEETGLTANIDLDVAAAMENVRKESGIPDMKMFEQALQQQDLTLDEYRDSLRKRLLFDRLIGRFVQSKITVMDSEISQYYQAHRERFTKPAEVDVSEIVVLFEGRNAEEARERADAALQKLKSGTAFVDVAKEYSEGPTASKGGAVGAFKKGALAPALENAVFTLNPGEHTGVVPTDYGLVIMTVHKRTDAALVPLEEVRAELQREIYYNKMQPELGKFADSLRLQSFIFVSPKYREEYPID
jgi:peptidyl-prolyl cis-trans isomerase SurA